MLLSLRSKMYWFVAFGVLFLDQLTKLLVRKYVLFGSHIGGDTFALVHTTNTGVVFGFFQGANWFFSLIALGVIIAFCTFWKKLSQDNFFSWALILGGATGNLIDRILFGAVTDFIRIGWWPAFNIADSCLMAGIALLLWQDIHKAYKT